MDRPTLQHALAALGFRVIDGREARAFQSVHRDKNEAAERNRLRAEAGYGKP